MKSKTLAKRLLALAIAACVVAGLVPSVATAAAPGDGDSVTIEWDGDGVRVSGDGIGYEEDGRLIVGANRNDSGGAATAYGSGGIMTMASGGVMDRGTSGTVIWERYSDGTLLLKPASGNSGVLDSYSNGLGVPWGGGRVFYQAYRDTRKRNY